MLINYRLKGQGKAVMLIHGFMENNKMWENMEEALSERFFVITPDLLGHGKTPTLAEVHSMELQAEKLVELLNELKIEKATFIGHSMGGYIAMAVAKNHPDRVERLCLLNSHTMKDSEKKKKQRLKSIELLKRDRMMFIEFSISALFNQEKLASLRKEVEIVKKWARETPLNGVIASIHGMLNREETTYLLRRLNIPVLIVLGEKDNSIDVEMYKKHIPENENIQVKILDTGHMAYIEAPEESLKLIRNFLS